MAEQLHYDPKMGDLNTLETILKNRLNTAEADLARARTKGHPEQIRTAQAFYDQVKAEMELSPDSTDSDKPETIH